MTEVAGTVHRLQERISNSYGFSGVIVAWLAKLNPFAVIIVSILFGALLVASREIQPSGISFLIQGITLFLVISSDVLLKYQSLGFVPPRRSKPDELVRNFPLRA